MVNEDSNSTEARRSFNNLLAQLVLNEDKLFSNFGYVAKLHKNAI